MSQESQVSGEIVDLGTSRGQAVLALLERARVPPRPPFYGLLYDYVAGVQSLAAGRVGDILNDRQASGDTVSERLYEEFVRPYASTEAADSTLEKMIGRLRTLDETIVATGEASRAQSASLKTISNDLQSGTRNAALLREWVDRLAIANTRTIAANATLVRELDLSSAELRETKAELAQLSRESLVDPLTGIANRAGLDAALSVALTDAHAGGPEFALALLDIDRFKGLNDTYGHPTGDQVLRLVGRVLLASVRTSDVVGRVGGDEYIAVLRDTNEDGALQAAEAIRRAIHDSDLSKILGPAILGGVTASIGVAHFRRGDSIVSMFERADRCLFEAKGNGRNRIAGERDLPPAADGLLTAVA